MRRVLWRNQNEKLSVLHLLLKESRKPEAPSPFKKNQNRYQARFPGLKNEAHCAASILPVHLGKGGCQKAMHFFASRRDNRHNSAARSLCTRATGSKPASKPNLALSRCQHIPKTRRLCLHPLPARTHVCRTCHRVPSSYFSVSIPLFLPVFTYYLITCPSLSITRSLSDLPNLLPRSVPSVCPAPPISGCKLAGLTDMQFSSKIK